MPDRGWEVGLCLLATLVWFQTHAIIDGIPKPLFAAQISLGRLDADMSEQELNLLKFTTCLMTQTGACATQVVGATPAKSQLMCASSCLYASNGG